VFGSSSEALSFQTLKSNWGNRFDIYPSLPLSNIIQIDKKDLTEGERKFIYNTSVDYTLCQQDTGEPILSIEFDGIGGGFNSNGEYVQIRKTDDPHRKLKMDLKLRVTKEADYPFIVVSYDEVEHLDEEDCLTILDGIIGQFLANKEFDERLNKEMEEFKDTLNSCNDYERTLLLQDWLLQFEVAMQVANNPIIQKADEYRDACLHAGFIKNWSVEFMDQQTDYEGVRIIVRTARDPIITGAQVRNFDLEGVSALSVAENVAEYLAYKRAYSIMRNEKSAD
jgi:hypothetical protein